MHLFSKLVFRWSEKTASEFVERAKCIIEQYGKIEVEDTKHKINGIITQVREYRSIREVDDDGL